jgi:hypothetical protein
MTSVSREACGAVHQKNGRFKKIEDLREVRPTSARDGRPRRSSQT